MNCEIYETGGEKSSEGEMEGVQHCVAEQHESGPQLGCSWGSVLLTACNSVEQGRYNVHQSVGLSLFQPMCLSPETSHMLSSLYRHLFIRSVLCTSSEMVIISKTFFHYH